MKIKISLLMQCSYICRLEIESNGRKSIWNLILFICKHTISQSTAYIGESADWTNFSNGLVEMKPRKRKTGNNFTDQTAVHALSRHIKFQTLILLSDFCQVLFGNSGIPSKHKLFRLDRFSRSSSLFPMSSIEI